MKGMFGSTVQISAALILCSSLAMPLEAQQTPVSAKQVPHPHLIEKTAFDWNHSGKMSTFSLLREEGQDGYTTDRLVIATPGAKRWSLSSHDDGQWATISEAGLSHLNRLNLVPTSKHFLFVSLGSADSDVYLILKGKDFGCCVGSLTVVALDEHRQPRVVFHASSHLLADLIPTADNQSLEMIGQSSDSEARALKNAQSYDPYRVYLLHDDRVVEYDAALSKAYTLANYCQWHGPKYDERFVAVGPTTGATHCRVLSESDFDMFRQKHPALFPEP